ncbi:hypothetical protein N9L66_00680 [Porticoccaceae bacterium]|nr:hypothetical protein [Porticoccaceae bacterium]MDA8663462.1 hypothetical protein [Porticoccaceae bacterium]MDA8682294.1 hypothetical protein [Porticoccaceae bacterium]MDA8788818.1 hypothetical protein [Porticoccaceae bacterium]MDB2486852.1 hypothetical protein [Porticoccaceae bacterium]
MGERAVLVFTHRGDLNDSSPSVYMHWGGKRGCIEPLLHVAKTLGFFEAKDLVKNSERVAALAGDWLKRGEPCEMGAYSEYARYDLDHGVYVIKSDGEIAGHIDGPYEEYSQRPFDQVVDEIKKAHVETICKPFEFEYMMLDRLKSDCQYFLGNGKRNEKHLWALNVKEHISEMKRLYNKVPIEPEWLSSEDIKGYEDRMLISSHEAEPQVPQNDDFSPGM